MKISTALTPFFLMLVVVASAKGESFEVPPVLSAADFLTAEQLRGPHHEIAQEVINDGYVNTYRILSDFGRFEAYGEAMLAIRLREVGALAELEELSRSKVFLDAFGRGAMGPFNAAKAFADKPVETLKGVPGGVNRMFKRTQRAVQEAGSGGGGGGGKTGAKQASQEYASRYFGVSGAERRWAEKLGVDPYTSNEILVQKIAAVAKLDAAGGFTARLTPVPRIPGLGTVNTMTKLAWSTDPRELLELNSGRLQERGVDPSTVSSFLANASLSPTVQTFLIDTLLGLEGVDGLSVVLEQGTGLQSEAEALFFAQTLHMIADLHHRDQNVKALLGGARIPAAWVGEGSAILLVPAEHIVWTEDIAAAFSGHLAEIGADRPIGRRELWIRGGLTPRCRSEFEGLGWRVLDHVKLPPGSGVG